MNWLLEKFGFTPVANADKWHRKWTTWLQALQLSFLALIALYITLPERFQNEVPQWAIWVVVGGAAVTTFITVFAANTAQHKIQPPIKYEPLQRIPEE